jgi:hypothetical protein
MPLRSRMNMSRRPFAVLVLAAALAAAGCDQNSATVSGQVTYKGEPLPGGTVTFHGEGGQLASAQINDGHYAAEKVPPGPVKVTVMVLNVPGLGAAGKGGMAKGPPGAAEHQIAGAAAPRKVVPVPKKYAAKETSGLSTTLEKGTQQFDIELK